MVQHTKMPPVTYEMYDERLRIPEQELAESLLMKHKHFVLGFEPGKGKSYPVVHCILEVQKSKDYPINVLVLSDATCIREMWKAEIMVQGILPKNTYFVTDRTAIGKVKDALIDTKWDVIVVDECQSLRSGVTRKKSKFAKLVHSLTKRTEYVFGMTGTISGNNNIEPWCVLHNLNVAGMGEIKPFVFKQNYCINELQYTPFGTVNKPTKLNDRGERIMETAYASGVMFWPYDDDDDMPEMNVEFKRFEVPATNEYENAIAGIMKLGEHESTMMKAQAIQKAQQALNGFLYYEDDDLKRVIHRVPNYNNPKLDYLAEECAKEKTIIGYLFQEDYTNITNTLDNSNISWTDNIRVFRSGTHQVLVLQCSRGKAANLQIAKRIIYYTSDFSFIYYKQFIHRTWRRGQSEPCTVTYLINDPGDNRNIEERVWKSLMEKQNIHDVLMSIKQGG